MFSPEDEEFEWELARLSGTGFFLQHPMPYPSFPAAAPIELTEEERELNERHRKADASIRAMLHGSIKEMGRSDEEIAAVTAATREQQTKIDERRLGYAGWLATNRTFRTTMQKFREKWGKRISSDGRFPRFPMSLMGEPPAPPAVEDREFYDDYLTVYQHWGLERLVSWELPVPLKPELVQPSLYHLADLTGAGVLVFAPWYLLRDKAINLHGVANRKSVLSSTSHLKQWLERQSGQWGHERYATMLKLYVYLELALKARYGDRLGRKLEPLDNALAGFLYGDPVSAADSVKKMRQELSRRLKAGGR